MDEQELFQRFVLRRPNTAHRPLLVLFALGRWHTRRQRWISYAEMLNEFRPLLERLTERNYNNLQMCPPFDALRREPRGEDNELWTFESNEGLAADINDPARLHGQLEAMNTQAGFIEEILQVFRHRDELVDQVANRILDDWSQRLPEVFGGNCEAILREVGLAQAVPATPEPPPLPPDGGAGFSDPENNREVEDAAIQVVIDWYGQNGWSVEPMPRNHPGLDLVCRRGEECEHVEVKGVSGTEASFFITGREVRQASTDPQFVLCIVTNALSTPSMTRYTGKEFLARFEFSPLQYQATLSDTTDQRYFDRITHNPLQMGGRPCIRGMRVTVGLIVGLLAAGRTREEILNAYPYLEAEDISQALAYAAWRLEERELPLVKE